jgi:hypothetical protein
MEAEEDSGFSVVVKRGVNPESAVEAVQGSASAESEQAPQVGETDQGPHPGGVPKLAVVDRLLMCIDILHQSAWISMGLVSDPASGQIERNLSDAKIAIDCVAFLAGKLEGQMDDSTQREIKRLVSDLQVNFVRQNQQQPS